MNPSLTPAVLRRAAERARSRPAFLGWVMARYEQVEAIPEDRLREQLRVAGEEWPRLQLCLRPRPDEFLPDVTRIAAEFGIDRATLAAVVRRVEALEVVRGPSGAGATVEVVREDPQQTEAGSLLAARTRKRKGPRRRKGAGDE